MAEELEFTLVMFVLLERRSRVVESQRVLFLGVNNMILLLVLCLKGVFGEGVLQFTSRYHTLTSLSCFGQKTTAKVTPASSSTATLP
jgi:hypothetical protein